MKIMKTVMFYELAPDGLSKIKANIEGYKARLQEFHSRGELLMAGAFANTSDGALGIFTTREAAEEFIKGDPFILNGVVSTGRLQEWNEVLAELA
jgi:hypothetical protein